MFRSEGGGRSLGRRFGWLWAAYAVSAYGTGFGFGAFSFVAILALDAGPAEVALLSAAGLAVGAAVAVPLGPWVEVRRKRPVMIAMDLTRCAALLSVPATYALGWLTFAQLLLVAVVVAAARIAFNAASGAYLKTIVEPGQLLVANGRFEATTWSATAVGPPLGGAAIGLLGPVVTLTADAVSHLLSALGIAAIEGREERAAWEPREDERAPAPCRRRRSRPAAAPARPAGLRAADLLDGWRTILGHPGLRSLFLNAIAVNGLIMAAEPALAVLMLDQLGFAPWQYGFAFALPCLGGLVGSRLSRRLVARHGAPAVLRVAGTLRACWPIGLALVGSGAGGLALVIVVELGLIVCIGLFNPVLATYRLQQTPDDRVARALTAWSISSSLAIATLTALWGVLAAATSPRTAIAAAGLLLLVTPLLLPSGRQLAAAGARPACT